MSTGKVTNIEGRLLSVGGIQFDLVATQELTCVGCAFKADDWNCTLNHDALLSAGLNCVAPPGIYKLHNATSEVSNA